MTGYFATPARLRLPLPSFIKMKDKNPSLYVLVDPVLGDDGSLYVSNEVATAIRDELLPLASCVTPNCFELGWLTGKSVSSKAEVLRAAATLPHKEILATSIPVGADNLATLAITGSKYAETTSSAKPSVPHGTGDFLAGLYFTARLNGFESPEALKLSSGILESAISRARPFIAIIGACIAIMTVPAPIAKAQPALRPSSLHPVCIFLPGIDRPVCLKLELFQHTGSFKPRGAFTNLVGANIPGAGVAAASGGNHGAAVAYAASILGIKARIFVPIISSPAKVTRIASYGASTCRKANTCWPLALSRIVVSFAMNFTPMT